MTCKEKIASLEARLKEIDQQIAQLRAMPGSASDPAIIAAIQDLQAERTALQIQLANERASCVDEPVAGSGLESFGLILEEEPPVKRKVPAKKKAAKKARKKKSPSKPR